MACIKESTRKKTASVFILFAEAAIVFATRIDILPRKVCCPKRDLLATSVAAPPENEFVSRVCKREKKRRREITVSHRRLRALRISHRNARTLSLSPAHALPFVSPEPNGSIIYSSSHESFRKNSSRGRGRPPFPRRVAAKANILDIFGHILHKFPSCSCISNVCCPRRPPRKIYAFFPLSSLNAAATYLFLSVSSFSQ